jgi:hypothetical protein
MPEINVCCPYLRTLPCRDTKEHRHLYCKAIKDVITNDDTVYRCISDNKWVLCIFYTDRNKR